MGWLNRILNRKEKEPPALQYPDQLAHEAKILYGNQKFRDALEKYGDAIDKLHTMYVIAERSRRQRNPGPDDLYILNGFESALGASKASAQIVDTETFAKQPAHYLQEIVHTIEREGGDARIYIDAVDRISRV